MSGSLQGIGGSVENQTTELTFQWQRWTIHNKYSSGRSSIKKTIDLEKGMKSGTGDGIIYISEKL